MSNRRIYFRNWTFASYNVGNGSKQIGLAVWWNSSRAALQINVGVLEVQIMREKF